MFYRSMSYKKLILSTFLVFLSFFGTDCIIHGNILMSAYSETASLWRPQDEMNIGLIQLVNFLISVAICYSYTYFVTNKTLKNTLLYVLTIGFVLGVSAGYMTYATMQITHFIAFIWFVGIIIQKLIAGVILYFIYRNK
jgi:hypothetical protein